LADSQTRKAPLNILLADDVEINRALVQAILEPHGHHIVCAQNGQIAFETYKSHHVDIVLMDIQMPEMDGLQASRSIRAYEQSSGRTNPVPIVAMTAFAGSEDRQICLDAGMNDYLTKPVKSDQLLQILNKYRKHPIESVEPAAEHTTTQTTPQAAQVEQEESVAVFAQKELLERLGGRSEMIPRFVGLFYKGVLPEMEGLVATLAAEDADGVRRHAHAIKGAAGNIAALRIHQTAAMIEKEAKEGDLTMAPQRLAVLQQEYLTFVEAFDTLGFTIEVLP
jgi:CheY-like chemotaxis protein/HPt (histidine-containing phosphotransfer) domain-containing protein